MKLILLIILDIALIIVTSYIIHNFGTFYRGQDRKIQTDPGAMGKKINFETSLEFGTTLKSNLIS